MKHMRSIDVPIEIEQALIAAFNKLEFIHAVHTIRLRDIDRPAGFLSVTIIFVNEPFDAGYQIGQTVADVTLKHKLLQSVKDPAGKHYRPAGSF